ncbi:MAG: ankyrin repeat domain-containing protein [Alphaproteobacteria bacterium]|nr:ankyrin repeat domain-containing protein [Alphaproteobacteria bacterium]
MVRNFKICCLCFMLSFFTALNVSAEASIYDIVNREDMDAFSDMVVLGYGIDDFDVDGYTPLMIAAALNKVDFAAFLISNGASVDRPNFNGLTALHHAAQNGHNEMIDILVSAGAEVNMPDFKGFTPIMYAILGEHRFTVEKLVALGADINYMNINKETPLRIAEKNRFNQIAAFLRSRGAQ